MSTSTTPLQQFYTKFQESRADLTFRLISIASSKPSSSNRDSFQQVNNDLSILRKELVDATPYLPTFDQRNCEDQLRQLEKQVEALRISSAPKSKFAFKRSPATAKPSPSPSQASVPNAPPATNAESTPTPTTNLSLGSHSSAYLTASSLPPPSAAAGSSDLTISKLEGCVVNLLPSLSLAASTSSHGGSDLGGKLDGSRPLGLTALHIRDIKDSLLIIGPVQGSVLMHNLDRCTVVVSCHQLRIHTSTRTNLYLHIPSHPVIEHCSGISFTGYPDHYPTGTAVEAPDAASKHLQVLDFSHIKSTHSPNWTTLPAKQAMSMDDWSTITDDDFGADKSREVPGLLSKYLPTTK